MSCRAERQVRHFDDVLSYPVINQTLHFFSIIHSFRSSDPEAPFTVTTPLSSAPHQQLFQY